MESRLSLALQVVAVLLLALIVLRLAPSQASPVGTVNQQPASTQDLTIVEKRLSRLVLVDESAYEELRAICARLPTPTNPLARALEPQCALAGLPPGP